MSKRKNKITRLDKLWSKAVIKRDKGICQYCGKVGDEPHHIIYRRYGAVRHLLDNGLTLCIVCHRTQAHDNPLAFNSWFQDNYPDRYSIIQKQRQIFKVDLDKMERGLKG